jgi:ParB family transcriptional regulator, chromosome partitioning protein
MTKPKGLGRGLGALLGDASFPMDSAGAETAPSRLPLSVLKPGRYQPRTRMDESALQDLASSIAQHGLMQPIVVRPLPPGPEQAPVSAKADTAAPAQTNRRGSASRRYEIIAGERRFRAATLAGLKDVPVIVRDVDDVQALQLALIENIQREDLNPLEQAQAIRRLIDEFGYSHEQAAEAIGRSRSATTNLLRLLNLADAVQTMLLAGDLDMGHARALLPVDRATQVMLAQEVVLKRLSVRETEKLIARALQEKPADPGSSAPRTAKVAARSDADLMRLQERVADALAAPVKLRTNARGGGRLTIDFASGEQFEGLLQRLGVTLEQH